MQLTGWALVMLFLAWSWPTNGSDLSSLSDHNGNPLERGLDFFPPNFDGWQNYLDAVIVTFQIACWGTLLSIIAAIPLGILASKNMTPWWIHQPARRLMDAARAINEMVFAMLFVVVVGLGPIAGILALFIHGAGILGQLFREAIEDIEYGPIEGIRATGANTSQEFIYGVMPQVIPHWIEHSLHRFDSNLRVASVVGIVGAGGIGAVLWEAVSNSKLQEACAILIIITLSIAIVGLFSKRLRQIIG
jgi:phosphonate transport system permease protein